MRVFWIFILACTVSWASGFIIRHGRRADEFTNRLERKLLRSSLRNSASQRRREIFNDEAENAVYSLPNTFVIKQRVPVAAVRNINARDVPISVAPSFRADVIEDDAIFEDDIGDDVSADSVEIIELPDSTEEGNEDVIVDSIEIIELPDLVDDDSSEAFPDFNEFVHLDNIPLSDQDPEMETAVF